MANLDITYNNKHRDIINTLDKKFEKSRTAIKAGFYLESIIIDTQIITMHIILNLENTLKVLSFENDVDTINHFRDRMLSTNERELYRFAFVTGSIDEDCYKELNKFYSKRSNVVHRYIMSNISDEELKKIAHTDVNKLLKQLMMNYEKNIERLGYRLKLVNKELERRKSVKKSTKSVD